MEDDKLVPKPPKVSVPAPQIRPDVKKGLDTAIPNLTNDEIQYMITKVKETLASRRSVQGGQAEPSAPPQDPYTDRVLQDLKTCEEMMTIGAPPLPRFRPSQGAGETEEGGSLLLDWVGGRLDKMLENPKVQDAVADLLEAIAKKVEGEK